MWESIKEGLTSLFAGIWDFIESGVNKAFGYVSNLSLWKMGIGGTLLWGLEWLNNFVKGAIDQAAALFDANPCALLEAVPESALYALDVLGVTYALTMCGAAVVIRFIIRRLPVIG